MKTLSLRPAIALSALIAAAHTTVVGCGDSPVPSGGNVAGQAQQTPAGGIPAGGTPAGGTPAGGTPVAVAADAGAGDAGAANLPDLPKREFSESDFAETDRSRDPFRTFSTLFVSQARSRVALQREVLIERYALDELELTGIVTRAPARALLTDPSKLGWVVKVGDFVGKAELVHSGGPTGTDVAVNWRVDRIREDDVVFIREDPAHPEIPPTTRAISLHPVDDQATPRR